MDGSIPDDPGSPTLRQGDTPGDHRKHWFQAKFFQRHRLFYRFSGKARIIVLAWVNDGKTLRAYGRTTNAYVVFEGMLDGGSPPDSFDALMKEAVASAERFWRSLKTVPGAGPDPLRAPNGISFDRRVRTDFFLDTRGPVLMAWRARADFFGEGGAATGPVPCDVRCGTLRPPEGHDGSAHHEP